MNTPRNGNSPELDSSNQDSLTLDLFVTEVNIKSPQVELVDSNNQFIPLPVREVCDSNCAYT